MDSGFIVRLDPADSNDPGDQGVIALGIKVHADKVKSDLQTTG
jgi:hypothetical protein